MQRKENPNSFNIKDEEIKKAIESKDISKMLGSLSPSDREKLGELLSDREKAKKVLESDAAKKIMKKLFGEK